MRKRPTMEDFQFDPDVPVSLRSYDAAELSDATALDTGNESMVQQSMKEEVDINTIMARFGATGAMPAGLAGGVFGDFSGIDGYEGAVEAIERANRGFMSLPAEVRERFKNDPSRLIRAAQSLEYEEFERMFEGKPVDVAPGVVPPVVDAT